MSTLAILILTFLPLVVFNKYVLKSRYTLSQLGRLALAIMLMLTGVSHFFKTAEMVQMLPDFLPFKTWVVYTTGLFEMSAAMGLLSERRAKLVSVALIAFFVAILPANIIGSLKHVELGGMENGPAYLFFRIPLQMFFIWWTYYFGIYLFGKMKPKRAESYLHSNVNC